MSQSNPSLPWYREGLRFDCTQCGKCCTGSPGFVWVTEEEMGAMAASLGLSLPHFKRLYVKRRENRYLLVEKKSADGHDCIFFQDRKCLIYQARPQQCRTYPFWQENLLSPASWEHTAEFCEGIRADAQLISQEVIDQTLQSQPNSGAHFVSESEEGIQ